MRYIFVLSNSLPKVTGPSFVCFERVKYLATETTPVDVFLPWPRLDWFRSFEEYAAYLRDQHDITTDHIKMYPLDSMYNGILRWYTMTPIGTLRLITHIRSVPNPLVVIEDPPCHLWGTPNAMVLRTMVPESVKLIHVMHTDYLNIIPPIMVEFCKSISQITFPKGEPHHYLFLYEETNQDVSKLQYTVDPQIHFIKPMFFEEHVRTTLPTGNTVYFIGKIDYRHKNLARILEWTTEVCDIHVYGKGYDVVQLQHDMARNPRIIYHGNISHDDQMTDPTFVDHKCYISLSTCEGCCTATAEAMAMNKYALVADVSCNACFKQSSNCVPVELDKDAFIAALRRILVTPPNIETNIEYMSKDIACDRFRGHVARILSHDA